MSKPFLFLILLFQTLYSNAQQYDHQWVFGYGADQEYQFGINLLDFNNGIVETSYYIPSESYGLGVSGSFINNINGELLLHTNHCSVRDKDWSVISGNELITTTGTGTNTCTDGGNNYGAKQSSLLLPDLENPSLTYVLHKDEDIDFDLQDIYSHRFMFSTIVEDADSFSFTKRSKVNQKSLVPEDLTACPNRAKDAWWVLLPQANSNIFERYIVGQDSVTFIDTQSIGIPFDIFEVGIGQAQYSPDARMFAINTETHGVLLYEFDNETGLLSNFRNITYPDSENLAQGLCFSPNARFIYVTTAENVYQIDLEQNDEIYHVGYYRSFDDTGWPVGLGMCFTGPDCRIYVSPGSTTFYLHAILNPDEKGAACLFAERVIELPANVYFHLPNLPQYRYLSGCDTTIVFPFTVATDELTLSPLKMSIHPTPARTEALIQFEESLSKDFRGILYNNIGMEVQRFTIPAFSSSYSLDVSNLDNGMYFIQDQSGKYLPVKLVKI